VDLPDLVFNHIQRSTHKTIPATTHIPAFLMKTSEKN
jgi:hypothetical protein